MSRTFRRPWNAGKKTRLYSRRQYGYIKHAISEQMAREMALTTLDQGVNLCDLPSVSSRWLERLKQRNVERFKS